MSLFSSNLPSMKFPTEKGNFAKFALLKTETYGDRSALIDGISGDGLSYNELKRHVLKFALALTRRGIKKGQVVSVIPESCVQTAVIYYGIMYIGAIVHPMNHLLQSDEMRTQLADAKPVLVIVKDTSLAEAESALDSSTEETPEIIVIGESTEHDTFTSLMAGVLDEDLCQVAPVGLDIFESPACVLYTSGTTGVPKGVLVSHAGLIMNGLSLTACPAVALVESDHDIVLVILTMFHGMIFVVLSYAFRHGATVVIGPSLSCCTPQDLCNLTDRYKVNIIMSPPSNVQAFIKSTMSMEGSLPTLHTWMTTGASMKGHIYESVKEKFTFKLTHYYGMTELGALTGTPKENVKQGSAGILLSDVQAKIKDLTTRSLLPANRDGELCFKSPTMMIGYLNKPEETQQGFDEDGFFSTGDIGHCDVEGNFYIVDRTKHILKREGILVSPSELENLLISHPAVNDAAVDGLPQQNGDDLFQAWVVRRDGQEVSEDDLCQYVADRRIWYKHLTGGVVFTDSIPRTGLGKILYRRLRDKSTSYQCPQ